MSLKSVLSKSGSDFDDGPQDALIDAAYSLVLDGYCRIDDFAEWGWTRSQMKGSAGQYFTYCTRPAPYTKQWATDAEGVPVR
jgi:hypothetical protein